MKSSLVGKIFTKRERSGFVGQSKQRMDNRSKHNWFKLNKYKSSKKKLIKPTKTATK